MGRQQAFDTTTAVVAARDVFWQFGYDAVSITDLEAATGLARSSLYHAFGSKHGLFDAAVQNYLDTIIRPRIAPLLDPSNTPADAARAIVGYFTDLAQAVAALPADSPRQGCLLVGAAPAVAGHDEPVRRVVAAYHAELIHAFATALTRAAPGAGADAGVPDARTASAVAGRARMLTSLSISAFTLARVDQGESIVLLHTGADLATEWTASAPA